MDVSAAAIRGLERLPETILFLCYINDLQDLP